MVLDADLSSSTKTAIFAKAFPQRFFNTGIAEANMMGVAAGLAASGKIPLHLHLLYLVQDELMNKYEILFVTLI